MDMRIPALIAFVLIGTSAALTGCSQSTPPPTTSGAGTASETLGKVKGSLPLCAGPSGQNLTPTLVVVAEQAGEPKASATFPATTQSHAYEFSLPTGTYEIHAGDWPAAQLQVEAGKTTVLDIHGACL